MSIGVLSLKKTITMKRNINDLPENECLIMLLCYIKQPE